MPFPYATSWRLPVAATGLLLAFTSCHRAPKPQSAGEEPVALEETAPSAPLPPGATPFPKAAARTQPVRTSPPPAEIWKEFSGEKAMAQVEKQISFGPRPSGSAELAKARQAIITSLQEAGWVVEQQLFTGDTPRGPIQFVNVIARHPGPDGRPPLVTTPKFIVCSHYDTKRFSTIRFVGASDGASSTGALLELARVLDLDPALAAQIELVFFDGEEAVQLFTETDGLYGSRYYASALDSAGRAGQYKFAILWDMIGDKDLTITLPPDSPADLARGIFDSATALNLKQHFSYFSQRLLDDHEPLNRHRIKAIDLIDFEYLPWHTADDTIDKLSGDSLAKVGAVTLHYLRRSTGK